jgi:preprotein translocase subunit SecG
MQTLIVIVHVMAALGVVGLVLLQQGKGADAGAAFGSGASATVFGARGSGSFLTRSTAILATVFFLTSLSLAYFSGRSASPASVTEIIAPAQVPAPAADAPAAQDKPDLPVPKQ